MTMVCIETGYLCQKQQGILCVISKQKLYAVLETIQQVDSSAFVTITQIKEARGQGFTRAREPLAQKIHDTVSQETEHLQKLQHHIKP